MSTSSDFNLGSLFNMYSQSQLDPEVLAKQRRQQGIISGVAGGIDAISGAIGQKQAESDIERFGAESDAIRQQMQDVKAPSIMSPENQAAAVRNATILGAGKPQEDSSELAAAKMAMDAGADPTKIQRALTEAEAQKDERARLEQQGAFKEGLGYAHQDAMSDYQKQMQNLGMDYDASQSALGMAQQQSLMAQQQKQKGFGNLAGGATKFLTSMSKNKDKQPDPITGLAEGVDFNSAFVGDNTAGGGGSSQILGGDYQFGDLTGGGFGDSGGGLSGSGGLDLGGFDFNYTPPPRPFAQGGAVQMTPGAFKHDDGDDVYEEGENEILGFARTENGLEDTGVRMTGGEFVINPKQAKGMEKAYDRIKRKRDPSRADLMALYEAVRFLDESQFD
jgi:hypothetical protein